MNDYITNVEMYPATLQDCFFASVTIAKHPSLQGKPLVVSHSASAQGRGEVTVCLQACRLELEVNVQHTILALEVDGIHDLRLYQLAPAGVSRQL